MERIKLLKYMKMDNNGQLVELRKPGLLSTNYLKEHNKVKTCLDAIRRQPNESQFGVALFAYHELKKVAIQRMMVLVPAGLGKSRIALATAHLFGQYIAAQSSANRLRITSIVFVYTTERLMQVESEGFVKIS